MRDFKKLLFTPLLLAGFAGFAQRPRQETTEIKNPMVDAIIREATENSQLEKLAHEFMDGIGPRLVGTPEMQKAGDWAVAKYKDWGIRCTQ